MTGSNIGLEWVLTTERNIIEVNWRLNSLYFSTDVEFLCSAAKVRHRRVRRIIGAKNVNSLFDLVGAVDIID